MRCNGLACDGRAKANRDYQPSDLGSLSRPVANTTCMGKPLSRGLAVVLPDDSRSQVNLRCGRSALSSLTPSPMVED